MDDNAIDVNVSVAVRIRPPVTSTDPNVDPVVVLPGPVANYLTINNIHGRPTHFPCDYVLPMDCNQNQVFATTINPLISYLLEGYNVTAIAFGQAGSGKSYTILGPGPNCALSETEYGIAPRAAREVFNRLKMCPEKRCRVTISFVEIYQEVLRDLLNTNVVNSNLQIKEDIFLGMYVDGAERIECRDTGEAFNCLFSGMNNRSRERAHTLFSLMVEQYGRPGELSKISRLLLVDLAGFERLCPHGSFCLDSSLAALRSVINLVACPGILPAIPDCFVPYTNSKLTQLLQCSLGGKAITLFITCISGNQSDIKATLFTLDVVEFVQDIKNRPTVNAFTPVTTPVFSENIYHSIPPSVSDNMSGMEFVLQQWRKLLVDAEGLFHQITECQSLTVDDFEHIQRWLCLKQECEEIVASQQADNLGQLLHRSLDVIGELSESEEKLEETTSCVSNTDSNEERNALTEKSCVSTTQSDVETDGQHIATPELLNTVHNLMDELKISTDNLIQGKQHEDTKQLEALYGQVEIDQADCAAEPVAAATHDGSTRRNSIHPVSGIVDTFEAHTNLLATASSPQNTLNTLALNTELPEEFNNGNLQSQIKHLTIDVEAISGKISTLEHTIKIKEEMLSSLVHNRDIRLAAKQRLERKLRKLQDAYKNNQLKLAHLEKLAAQDSTVQTKMLDDIQKYSNACATYKQKMKDLSLIQHLTEDSAEKVVKWKQSLEASKRQVEKLKKQLRKEEKLKMSVEKKILNENEAKQAEGPKPTEAANASAATDGAETPASVDGGDETDKVSPILQVCEGIHDTKEGADCRKAIRKLRKTKDRLINERCIIREKCKIEKVLTAEEDRKLLEIEEAIDAIDAAIEFKNEILCGRKEDFFSEVAVENDGVENLLMKHLSGLSLAETKMLLFKYFQKVIDLRDSGRKQEVQIVELETQAELQGWRFQALSHAMQQSKFAAERHMIAQQQSYEEQIHLLLRHCAEESGTESAGALAPADLSLRRESRTVRRRESHLTVHATATRAEEAASTALAIPQTNLRRLQASGAVASGVAAPTRIIRVKNKIVIEQHKSKKSPG